MKFIARYALFISAIGLFSSNIWAQAAAYPKRLEAQPDLPTVNEALGLKSFEADQWYSVVAPVGTPREIVMKLNAQINLP